MIATISFAFATSENKPSKNSAPSASSSSPWELSQDSPVSESSPWELAPRRPAVPTKQSDEDLDEAPAGAYGAYAVGPRRRARRPTQKAHNVAPRTTAQPASVNTSPWELAPVEKGTLPANNAQPAETRAEVEEVEDIEFRKSVAPDAYIASSFFARGPSATVADDDASSSKSSSRKSSPVKVRGKEAATRAETSSLLTHEGDDGDERDLAPSLPSSAKSSPKKPYIKSKHSEEQGSALLGTVEPNAYRDEVEVAAQLDLEWEDEGLPAPPLELIATQTNHVDGQPEPPKREPDLLLSYQDVEGPPPENCLDLDEFLASPVDDNQTDSESKTDNSLALLSPGQSSSSGYLLSEIMLDNPSFGSFLLNPPPPPPQFTGDEDLAKDAPELVEDLNRAEPNRETPPVGPPRRVDEEIEVIDLDEEPKVRDRIRRNSFDQARELGNVMD